MATERFMPVERSEGSRSSMPATPTISSRPRTICWIWSSCEVAALAQGEGDVFADGDGVEERAVLEDHGDLAADLLQSASR